MNTQVNMNKPIKKKIPPMNNIIYLMLFFPISVFYCEIVTRLSTFGELKFSQLLTILILSAFGGLITSFVLSLIRNRLAVRIVMLVCAFVNSLVCTTQIVYYNIFNCYYNWADITMAGEAAKDFSDMLGNGIVRSIFPMILVFLPFFVLAVFNKRFTFYPVKKVPAKIPFLILSSLCLCFIVFSIGITANKSNGSAFYTYVYPDSENTYKNFGILTGSRLNIERLIFGNREGGVIIDPDITIDGTIFTPNTGTIGGTTGGTGTGTDSESTQPPKVYGDNIMDIDFSTLINGEKKTSIKSLHTYFSSQEPTKQNEYTGMFEGKNLIFITLEGFCSKVINPELTPTLYKMSQEGFVFENYYCSVWSGSTITGEFANITGNMYMTTDCFRKYTDHYQPFVLGNQLGSLGYNTAYYHGHTYDYYKRNQWVPNLGYDTYLGVGNGLEKLEDSEGKTMGRYWPNSDHEVAKVTINQYIDKQPFHVYYMSISGHANYNFLSGNKMCMWHKNEILEADLPYKYTAVQAYFACQLEVEYMLKELTEQLEAAGILDDTVFVMAPDHFPYGIDDYPVDATYTKEEALGDLYGLDPNGIFNNLDLYRNSLIIWSSSMEEPVKVDKPCSAIDILPTVSNLFGLEYDSRLMMGKDIMSDAEPLVFIRSYGGSQYCWVTRYGSYVPKLGFKKAEGYDVEEDALEKYVEQVNATVKQKWNIAKNLVDLDYYKYLKDYI